MDNVREFRRMFLNIDCQELDTGLSIKYIPSTTRAGSIRPLEPMARPCCSIGATSKLKHQVQLILVECASRLAHSSSKKWQHLHYRFYNCSEMAAGVGDVGISRWVPVINLKITPVFWMAASYAAASSGSAVAAKHIRKTQMHLAHLNLS